jgi:hypothetical protein
MFVLTTRQGRPVSPYTLVKYWHDVRKAAGLGTLRLQTAISGLAGPKTFIYLRGHGSTT